MPVKKKKKKFKAKRKVTKKVTKKTKVKKITATELIIKPKAEWIKNSLYRMEEATV